jgi:hypothetical protein
MHLQRHFANPGQGKGACAWQLAERVHRINRWLKRLLNLKWLDGLIALWLGFWMPWLDFKQITIQQ